MKKPSVEYVKDHWATLLKWFGLGTFISGLLITIGMYKGKVDSLEKELAELKQEKFIARIARLEERETIIYDQVFILMKRLVRQEGNPSRRR